MMTENDIATVILDAAFKIHRTLGPGLLESVYQATLDFELQKRGLRVVQQVGLPVYYEEIKLELGFRVDLIVADKVIIEIKSVEALAPVHRKQLLTYLRLMKLRLGLLLNFNVELMKNGIQRVVNGLAQ
ncbi:MAG TPA: GxxExxY protein [Pyrinomonadaceae bacterium]|nr:GxxExxY protein [Pyrinomonadaceae bacterium]